MAAVENNPNSCQDAMAEVRERERHQLFPGLNRGFIKTYAEVKQFRSLPKRPVAGPLCAYHCWVLPAAAYFLTGSRPAFSVI